MRLRQIEIFYHVYREGSISSAARELHVSQPSVSKVLRYAEDQLGFALFRREKGRLFATPAADELFVEIEDIYKRISAFDRTTQNIRKRKGGHIRFGVLPSLSLDLLPECIATMRLADPEMSFEVTTLHSSEMNLSLLEKRCDICIGFGNEDDERLSSKRLGDAELLLVAPFGYEGIPEGKVDLGFLHQADFIGLQDSGPAGVLLSKSMADRQIVPHEVVTAHTYHIALSLVSKGVGISVVDQYTAASSSENDLTKHHFVDPLILPVRAVSHRDSQQPELIESCLAALSKVVKLMSSSQN